MDPPSPHRVPEQPQTHFLPSSSAVFAGQEDDKDGMIHLDDGKPCNTLKQLLGGRRERTGGKWSAVGGRGTGPPQPLHPSGAVTARRCMLE